MTYLQILRIIRFSILGVRSHKWNKTTWINHWFKSNLQFGTFACSSSLHQHLEQRIGELPWDQQNNYSNYTSICQTWWSQISRCREWQSDGYCWSQCLFQRFGTYHRYIKFNSNFSVFFFQLFGYFQVLVCFCLVSYFFHLWSGSPMPNRCRSWQVSIPYSSGFPTSFGISPYFCSAWL